MLRTQTDCSDAANAFRCWLAGADDALPCGQANADADDFLTQKPADAGDSSHESRLMLVILARRLADADDVLTRWPADVDDVLAPVPADAVDARIVAG